MTTSLKKTIAIVLNTLKAETIGILESRTYSSIFNADGTLHIKQLNKVARALPQTSSQDAFKELRTVLDEYEKKTWFEKLLFRWTSPHPIDVYYQLDEIDVWQQLEKEISADGKTLSPVGIQVYQQSRLPNKIDWITELTGGFGIMLQAEYSFFRQIDALAQIEAAQVTEQPTQTTTPKKTIKSIHTTLEEERRIEREMTEVYNNFKSKSMIFIVEAVTFAASSQQTNHERLNQFEQFKEGIAKTRQAAKKELDDYLGDAELSKVSKEQKIQYCGSMDKWETFTHSCCDTLATIPQDKIHKRLKAKAEKPKVQSKWTDDILQEVNVAKRRLIAFFNDISKNVTNKLNAWTQFEEKTQQRLEMSCALYPTEALTKPETQDAVLGLCYQTYIHQEALREEFSDTRKALQEAQQKEAEETARKREAKENAKKQIVPHDATPDIATFIKASNKDLHPDEIPAYLEGLKTSLDKATTPKKQLNLFNEILFWQNRYLEAASWYCTAKAHNITKLAAEHQQVAKTLYYKLAIELHPDRNLGNEARMTDYMTALANKKEEYNGYVSDLLETCFNSLRKQTPWLERVWKAKGFDKDGGRTAARQHGEKQRQEMDAFLKAFKAQLEQDRRQMREAIERHGLRNHCNSYKCIAA